jgi:type I restriction enzyme M protein
MSSKYKEIHIGGIPKEWGVVRLGDANIKKIARAYEMFKNADGFARVVSLDEVKENDYNLNVTLYVFPEEKAEEIDIEKEWDELRKIEKAIGEVEERIQEHLKEVQKNG